MVVTIETENNDAIAVIHALEKFAGTTVRYGEARSVAQKELDEERQKIVNRLKPMFFGNEQEATHFLVSIQGMRPTQITNLVNLWVGERRISDLSRKRNLWQVLYDYGIYTKSESNWNSQVK